MKKILPLIDNFLGFTGLWLATILYFITRRTFPNAEAKHILRAGTFGTADAKRCISGNHWKAVTGLRGG